MAGDSSKYVKALLPFFGDGVEGSPEAHAERMAEAVMAVADEEQAALRAEDAKWVEAYEQLDESHRRVMAERDDAEDRLRKVVESLEFMSERGYAGTVAKVNAAWRDDVRTLRSSVLAAPTATPEAAERDANCVGLCGHGKDPGACPSGCTVDHPAPVVAPPAEDGA